MKKAILSVLILFAFAARAQIDKESKEKKHRDILVPIGDVTSLSAVPSGSLISFSPFKISNPASFGSEVLFQKGHLFSHEGSRSKGLAPSNFYCRLLITDSSSAEISIPKGYSVRVDSISANGNVIEIHFSDPSFSAIVCQQSEARAGENLPSARAFTVGDFNNAFAGKAKFYQPR